MARMLDALNQPTPGVRPAAAPGVVPQQEEAPEGEDGPVPFIEVGPRRSVEASPGVLEARSSFPLPFVASRGEEDRRGEVRPTPTPAPRPGPLPSVRSERAEHPTTAGPHASPLTFRPVAARSFTRKSRLAAELVAYHAAGEPASAGYRDLLNALLESCQARDARTLFFCSARVEAGTTTVLLNLAITAALAGWKVVVVDANLRRPGLAARLGLGEVPGLREVLGEVFSLERALQTTEVDNLTALTSGPLPGPDRLTVDSAALARVLGQLRERCDLVFVDGPRWDGKADVTACGTACEAVFLVVTPTEADTPAIEGLMQLIPEQGGRLAGCILAGR